MTVDGQELRDVDLNLLGQMAGLMDDRVFAEIFKPIGNNGSGISKYILPYSDSVSATPNLPGRLNEVVRPGSLGYVNIFPFRAIIGSRIDYATDGKQFLQEVRSAIFSGIAPDLHSPMAITANASGNARIDLIYASIAPDVNTAAVTRKVKNPSTGVITTPSISVSKITSVGVARVQGTPAASPLAPALPADGGGNYYIPLAYVRVPNGFGAGSAVADEDILHISTCIQLAASTGAAVMRSATGNVTLSAARLSTWANSGTRPNYQLPATMSGEETLWIALDCTDASSANWSHADLGLVDNSRDWRNRIFNWTAVAGTGQFAWAVLGGSAANRLPIGDNAAAGTSIAFGFGESFNDVTGQRMVGQINSTNMTAITQGTVQLYVDSSDGSLRVDISSGPVSHKLLIKLTASAPFHNT